MNIRLSYFLISTEPVYKNDMTLLGVTGYLSHHVYILATIKKSCIQKGRIQSLVVVCGVYGGVVVCNDLFTDL